MSDNSYNNDYQPILKKKKFAIMSDDDSDQNQNSQENKIKKKERKISQNSGQNENNGQISTSRLNIDDNDFDEPIKKKIKPDQENESKKSNNFDQNKKKDQSQNNQEKQKEIKQKTTLEKTEKQVQNKDQNNKSNHVKPKESVKQDSSKKNDFKGEGVSSSKKLLIYTILKRWWFCLPEWPPKDYDYSSSLRENQLRLVDFALWKLEPNFDENGFKKVYSIQGYEGLFKDFNVIILNKGQSYDLRPKEGCPSFENFKNKSFKELADLQELAYQNQIKELEAQPQDQSKLLQTLKSEHSKAKRLVQALNKQ